MNQPATTTRRRWSSYSLRSLFVLITLVAIGLGWVASERRQSAYELEIAEQLKANRVQVELAGLFDDKDQSEQSRLRTVLGLVLGPRVRSLSANGDASLADLPQLVGLKSVGWVNLNGTSVTNLSPLAELTNLGWLNLDHTPVRDLRPLVGLNNLEELCLSRTPATDLAPLAGLRNLRVLYLIGTQATDQQVKSLQQALPNCKIVRQADIVR